MARYYFPICLLPTCHQLTRYSRPWFMARLVLSRPNVIRHAISNIMIYNLVFRRWEEFVVLQLLGITQRVATWSVQQSGKLSIKLRLRVCIPYSVMCYAASHCWLGTAYACSRMYLWKIAYLAISITCSYRMYIGHDEGQIWRWWGACKSVRQIAGANLVWRNGWEISPYFERRCKLFIAFQGGKHNKEEWIIKIAPDSFIWRLEEV